jgi:acyl dehydratase
LKPAEIISPLRHTPDEDVTQRYAAASGDHNPIHLDPAAARAAGLPSPILHGLYTMALVARCASQAGGNRELRALAVDFRALGFPGEEIEVSGVVEETSERRVSLRLVARQGRRRLIRNAKALLEYPAP